MGDQEKIADQDIIPLNKSDFIQLMAEGKYTKLYNEHEQPLDTLVHPLTYSKQSKKHPDMRTIPASYLFQRGFKKIFNDLSK